MRALILGLTFLLASPAFATTQDDFRAMVWAGDTAGVKAALVAAEASDWASSGEPEAQRALFHIFLESQPKVGAFTESWLAAEPESPLALTARGWQVYSLGFDIRGEASSSETFAEGLRIFRANGKLAMDMAQRAIAADPKLISASDLLLRTTVTQNARALIPVELERIMALHPNRVSLMKAMRILSPQWGGTAEQVELVCNRYAPMVKSVPGYDANICKIDAAYSAQFSASPQMDAAREALWQTDNPVLDYAKLADAIDFKGPPDAGRKLLEAALASRPLTPKEGAALDMSRGTPRDMDELPEFRKALTADIPTQRRLVLNDPYSPDTVLAYVSDLKDMRDQLKLPYQRDNAIAALKTLLHGAPYNSDGWLELADATLANKPFPMDDVSLIAETQPYFDNAIVYSNYSYKALLAALSAKFWAALDPNNGSKAKPMPAPDTPERVNLDAVLNCPLVKEFRLMNMVCAMKGMGQDQCGQTGYGITEVLKDRLTQLHDTGSCNAEFAMPDAQLLIIPAKNDF